MRDQQRQQVLDDGQVLTVTGYETAHDRADGVPATKVKTWRIPFVQIWDHVVERVAGTPIGDALLIWIHETVAWQSIVGRANAHRRLADIWNLLGCPAPVYCASCDDLATRFTRGDDGEDPLCEACYANVFTSCGTCRRDVRIADVVSVQTVAETRIDPAEYEDRCPRCGEREPDWDAIRERRDDLDRADPERAR